MLHDSSTYKDDIGDADDIEVPELVPTLHFV
jgi:hypothetical protein